MIAYQMAILIDTFVMFFDIQPSQFLSILVIESLGLLPDVMNIVFSMKLNHFLNIFLIAFLQL